MFDPKALRRVMGCFATGVAIITTRDRQGNFYGLTANAVSSLSLTPPLVLICIDRKAESFAHFYDSRTFVVNILTVGQEALSSRFAQSGGDKFTGVPCRIGRLGTPILDGVLGYLECRIVETHDGGDHVIHVGEVEEGQLESGEPLLFFQGRYRHLADG